MKKLRECNKCARYIANLFCKYNLKNKDHQCKKYRKKGWLDRFADRMTLAALD